MNDPPIPAKPQGNATGDPRVAAIGKIWTACIPLFVLSIPLAFLVKFTFLPLVVLIGAVLATCVVWYGPHDKAKDDQLQVLQERIDALEERLQNVETLSRVELELAERRKS